MQLTWYGHSAFRLDMGDQRILIDPFLSGNPQVDEDVAKAASDGITHIALTHAHADHVGDTVSIAKETGATVIANFELANFLQAQGVETIDPGNTGGTLHHGAVSVTFVQAFHSSAFCDDKGVWHSLGMPNGLVFHGEGEKTVYHMGDTDIFGDMALIAELHQPAIGLVPVGDRFTMGGAVAALACKRFFSFETVIPCHFGTFPILEPSADAFITAMGEGADVRTPAIGEAMTL